jgi:hypothetical protein
MNYMNDRREVRCSYTNQRDARIHGLELSITNGKVVNSKVNADVEILTIPSDWVEGERAKQPICSLVKEACRSQDITAPLGKDSSH